MKKFTEAELKVINKLAEYPEVKIVLWRAGRVFVATLLTQLGLGLIGVSDLNALKVLLVSALSAGIVAVGKALRDEFGDIEKTSLVDKLPV